MPPCGYRPAAVIALKIFLSDNLDYFIELYEQRGLTILQAVACEKQEIRRIELGERGGPWSSAIVKLNQLFYAKLDALALDSWLDVREAGVLLIDDAVEEWSELLNQGVHIVP